MAMMIVTTGVCPAPPTLEGRKMATRTERCRCPSCQAETTVTFYEHSGGWKPDEILTALPPFTDRAGRVHCRDCGVAAAWVPHSRGYTAPIQLDFFGELE